MGEEMVLGLPRPPPSTTAHGASEASGKGPQGLGRVSTRRAYLGVAVLCYINLINYMDWFTVAGVLQDIQKYFGLRDGVAGLLHTVFILCFLFSAPVFGYLGDRHNRKIILSAGIILWSGITLISSFATQSMTWLFFMSRGLVGVGTASYSTVAPTIIADLFEKDRRTWMLSLFYIFIPVGSGLGYILSASMAEALGFWGWGFRVTPCMGLVGLVLLVFLVPGTAKKHVVTHSEEHIVKSTWFKDVSSLCKNWSFVWSSLGVTTMGFITGALGFWMPVFFDRAQIVLGLTCPCVKEPCNTSNSRIFGGMTIATGILGVVIGAEAARRYKKVNARADPLICSVGLIASAPCLYVAIMVAQDSILATYILIALGEFLLSLNWAVVTDILLYVVTSERQSTAMSLQLFVSHLLGDAGSPYLIGLISDTINKTRASSHLSSFRSLQYSFVLCTFVTVLGGGFFLLTALYIEEDRKKAAAPSQGFENKSYVLDEEQRQGNLPAI